MIIEKYQAGKTASKVSIRPYLDPVQQNMGLERYNMALFEGAVHEEPLVCLEQHGIRRYVTGLNEFAPEVRMLEEDERNAKVKQIRLVVADLEKSLASNVIDVTDKDFWSKVKLLRPDNDEFWDKIIIRCGNEPLFLDVQNDPYDLIKMIAVEAGGFSIVAKSLEDAAERPVAPKFYLDKYEQTASIKTEVKKMRNKALAELQKLFDKNQSKLLYVAKVVDADSTQYKKSTPPDVIYENMDNYINGLTVDRDKKKTAERFNEIAALDMETLKLRAMVKDGTYYKLIATRGDGYIYHIKSNTMMGKNPSDIVEFLKNPLNEEILKDMTTVLEKYWNS
jgi:hypothetical protein